MLGIQHCMFNLKDLLFYLSVNKEKKYIYIYILFYFAEICSQDKPSGWR